MAAVAPISISVPMISGTNSLTNPLSNSNVVNAPGGPVMSTLIQSIGNLKLDEQVKSNSNPNPNLQATGTNVVNAVSISQPTGKVDESKLEKFKILHWSGKEGEDDNDDGYDDVEVMKTPEFIAGMVCVSVTFAEVDKWENLLCVEQNGELVDVDDYHRSYLVPSDELKEFEGKEGFLVKIASRNSDEDEELFFCESKDFIDGARYALGLLGKTDQKYEQNAEPDDEDDEIIVTGIVEIKENNKVIKPIDLYPDFKYSGSVSVLEGQAAKWAKKIGASN